MALVNLVKKNIHRWGQDAALRNAKKSGVPFVAAYAAVFNKLPTKV